MNVGMFKIGNRKKIRDKWKLQYRIGRNDGGREEAARGKIGEEQRSAGRRRIQCIHYYHWNGRLGVFFGSWKCHTLKTEATPTTP